MITGLHLCARLPYGPMRVDTREIAVSVVRHSKIRRRVDWDDFGNILPGSVLLRRPIGGYQMLASRRASQRLLVGAWLG
jgi:hypothetical protein